MRFDHMGVAVADLEASVGVYERLFGYRVLSGPFDDPAQQARVVFLGSGRPGDFVIELIAPLSPSSHVARVVAKGAGAYHVCYEVPDIEKTLAEMRGGGCMIVANPVPAVAYQGRRIAWLFTPAKQLIELVEAPKAAVDRGPAAPIAESAIGGTAEIRNQIDAAVVAGEATAAHGLLAKLWRLDPGPATAGFVATRFDKIKANLSVTPCRVAFLRSFTVEPVLPLLRAAAAVNGIDVSAWVGDFNTYQQEVIDPSSRLYAFDPTVIVFAVQARDLAPDLWDGFTELPPGGAEAIVDRVLASYRSWIGAIRVGSKAHVVIHGLETPESAAAGVYDAQDSRGQAACIRRINAGLVELARQNTGVYVLDYDALVARHGLRAWHDERKWRTMRMPIAAPCLIYLANEWLRFLHPVTGRLAKCLVLDLDNTLWGGVIGEDGMHGIQVGLEHPGASYREFQRVILDLYHRGVILAVCSKNNAADAMEALEKHDGMLLRPHHFAALRINWKDKGTNLREIAAELNIGIDSLAFFDDNPAERELVRGQVPEVMVIEPPADPGLYARVLRECPLFERLSLSAEDRERGKFYAQDRQRAELEQAAGTLEGFYRSLKQEVEFGAVTAATLARVAQLTQKTNQFNMTTKRYSEAEVEALAADPRWIVRWLRVKDRFGDNGIVGLAMAHEAERGRWEIDNILMSCRVIGRTVETAVLATLIEQVRAAGARAIGGWFIPTKKNAPAKDFYSQHRFTLTSEEGGKQRWEMDLTASTIEPPPWISRSMVAAQTAEAPA
ncbi:MAG: HAD-IIIC family phosphatase [Phycisphaerales bacterium]